MKTKLILSLIALLFVAILPGCCDSPGDSGGSQSTARPVSGCPDGHCNIK